MKNYLLSTALSIPVLAFAGSGTPIQHVHGERSHTHSLPDTGRNHSHNSSTKPAKSAKLHSHSGRSHSHILPKSGANHNHTQKDKYVKKSGWVYLAESDNVFVEAKAGSYEETKTKSGKKIAAIIVQYDKRKTKSISLMKQYVSLSDCKKGSGKLVSLNMSGVFEFEVDIVIDGSSIGSATASAICRIANKNLGKGI